MKKWHVILVILLAIVLCHLCSAEDSKEITVSGMNVFHPIKKLTFREMLGRRLSEAWSWMAGKENTFVGRCIGVARKLKIIMPMMVFKMGVIITILIFLTIFSMKSLGLLLTLLFINTTGFVGKLALKAHEAKQESHDPQDVHFHVHPDKIGYNQYGHSSPHEHYRYDPWDRNLLQPNTNYNYNNNVNRNNQEVMTVAEKLALLRLYNRLGSTYGYSEYDTNTNTNVR